ncbi:MAG: chemotaxis protein CheR [Burkholderiales bacterium]|nr:chemotaxis protein CheR [Burkholderiales bacterium]
MTRQECIAFLQWALPQLGLRWAGYRKVQGLVCKRLAHRLREIGVATLAEYRERIARDESERARLDALCRIPISRFYRDRGVFDALRDAALPALAGRLAERGQRTLRAWCAGCASGEEPYSLAIVWQLAVAPRFPRIALAVLASNAEPELLARAARGCYRSSSLKDLPKAWLPLAFDREDALYCVREPFRGCVAFAEQDIRIKMPTGPFDLVLCRNLAFTYFDAAAQERVAAQLAARLAPGGMLVLGSHEKLPGAAAARFAPGSHDCIYARV